MITRRTFLRAGVTGIGALAVGAGGYEAIEAGILPGKLRLARLTGACDVDAMPPRSAAVVRTGEFASAARGRRVGWALATPPGVPEQNLPVVLVLHGRGEDHRAAFDALRLHDFLAASVAKGGPPFALASVDGGDRYWHPRADGDDPLRMLTDEFLPLLAGRGLGTRRIGMLGWSMGGYGALLVARQARQSRSDSPATTTVAVAAAGSPALFPSYAASAAGAFDSAADYDRYGMLAASPDTGATALFVCCGADDAFTAQTRRYRANASPTPAGGISRGCHTGGYWRSVAAEQIAFVGRHLT